MYRGVPTVLTSWSRTLKFRITNPTWFPPCLCRMLILHTLQAAWRATKWISKNTCLLLPEEHYKTPYDSIWISTTVRTTASQQVSRTKIRIRRSLCTTTEIKIVSYSAANSIRYNPHTSHTFLRKLANIHYFIPQITDMGNENKTQMYLRIFPHVITKAHHKFY